MSYTLEKGQTYLVGADTLINIIDLNEPNPKKYSNNNRRCGAGEEDEFIKFLFQEKIYNKAEIHGLTEQEKTLLDFMICNYKEEENQETEVYAPSFDRYTF